MNTMKNILSVSLLTFVFLSFFLPGIAYATGSGNTQAQLNQFALFPNEAQSLTDFRVYVSNFYLFSIGASILVAVLLMMIGGVVWLTSAGNQGRISKAKEYIVNSIIGVVLLLGSYALIQAINPRLVQLDDPNLPKIPAFGSCLTSGAPSGTQIADATHTCILTQQADCPEGGVFDARKSCDQVCKVFSGEDGGCSLSTPVVTRSAAVDAVNSTPLGACFFRRSNGNEICQTLREAQCISNSNVTVIRFVRGEDCPSTEENPEAGRCAGIAGSYYFGRLGVDRLTPKGFLDAQALCQEHVCGPVRCEVNTAAEASDLDNSLWCTCKDPA